MKRAAVSTFLFLTLLFPVFSESAMTGLFRAADQVSTDLLRILKGKGDLLIGGISSNMSLVVLGDLFADLTANRLAGRSGFQPQVIKQYTSGQYAPEQFSWVLSGSLYDAGAGILLTLQLLETGSGVQLKGWEFALGKDGLPDLLRPSAMVSGGSLWDSLEPNNTPEEASLISLPFSGHGLTLGGDDEDWFGFEVPQTTGNVVMILEAATGGSLDTYMELYAPDNMDWPVAEDDDTDGGNAVLEIPLKQPGLWNLKVQSYSDDEEGEYSLNVSLRDGVFGPGEPDETVELASRLNVGASPVVKRIDHLSDEDWFRVRLLRPLLAEEVLRIETMGELDLTMYITDEDGGYILEDDDSGQGNNPMVMASGLDTGTYFVIVSNYGGELGLYEIMANVTVPAVDKYEEDNTMEDPSRIAADGTLQTRNFSPPGDEDWVAFEVAIPGTYEIRTRGEIDTYLELYDSEGDLIEEGEDGDDQNALIEVRLPAGSYSVLVSPAGDASPDDPYELSVVRLR
jgi:hypothetical protein